MVENVGLLQCLLGTKPKPSHELVFLGVEVCFGLYLNDSATGRCDVQGKLASSSSSDMIAANEIASTKVRMLVSSES